jgi:crotonobetainyl-CoA:carnitine CoA-transferase CaiB-like acyl-CoA transferase
MDGPFCGLRVLELGMQAEQTGKLLGDLAADVVKVEAPGSRTASSRPTTAGGRTTYDELVFWAFNTSKRSITLDLETESGRELLLGLSRTADVVLDGLGPGMLEGYRLEPAQLRSGNPRLIVLRASPFGQDGPWSGYRAGDLVSMALGGIMMSCGYEQQGTPPICPDEFHSRMVSGIWGLIGVAAGLVERERSGEGQSIDLATHDALAITAEQSVMYATAMDVDVRRQAGRHAAPDYTPPWTFRCNDGRFVSATLFALPPGPWAALVEWMRESGSEADLADPGYYDADFFRERIRHVSDVIAAFLRTVPAEEVFHRAQSIGLAWGIINTPDDLLADPHLAARGFFQPVTPAGMDELLRFPGPPYEFERSPWKLSCRPPVIGEHNGSARFI